MHPLSVIRPCISVSVDDQDIIPKILLLSYAKQNHRAQTCEKGKDTFFSFTSYHYETLFLRKIKFFYYQS